MTTLNSKLRLQLLGNKTIQRRSGKGFTLIELMVTVATLGVLSAAAFPAFQNAQIKASAGSTIGSMQGYAKECATNAITGDTSILSATGITITGTDGSTTTGLCSEGATLKNTTAFDGTKIGGLKCGSDIQDATTEKVCTLTVTSTGEISGAWGAS